MKKKGFTVVELIVSFALTTLIVALLFQMLLSLKDMYVASGIKTQMLNKQALMSTKINSDFENKGLKIALKCGENCVNFIFEDNTSKKLIIHPGTYSFTYGDYTTKLVDGSEFGIIAITTNKTFGVSTGVEDSFLQIKVPVIHQLLTEDFGINLLYQYDSRTSSISDVNFSMTTEVEEKIFLKGESVAYSIDDVPYVDPGYYVIKSDGAIVDNDTDVDVTGTVGNTVGTTYTIIYTLRDSLSVVLDIKVRNVTIVDNETLYDYTGAVQSYTVPATGVYQFELWGAQGGGTSEVSKGASLGGTGSYTKGTVSLDKDDIIYLYVGAGGPIITTVNVGTASLYNATFNGGGAGALDTSETADAGEHGFAGGGATDIRLSSGTWNDTSGLRSRIMVAGGGAGGGWSGNGSADQYYTGGGGFAGGLIGGIPSGATTSTVGTQTTGYSFGIGGNGIFASANNNGTGGGGGGYYGGYYGLTFAKPNSSGSGGSSFISGYPGVNAIDVSGVHTNQSIHYSGLTFYNMLMTAGDASMPNPRGAGNITGNSGNGYARITVIGISSN